MPTIIHHWRITNTLDAYFYGVQFFDSRTNELDIGVLDFIDLERKVTHDRINSQGIHITCTVYEVDVKKLTDCAHEKYWGLFPKGFLNFRLNGGEETSEFKAFIAKADSQSKSGRTFDVFGYFNELKEADMKKASDYAAYSGVFPAGADITNMFYESIKGIDSKASHYICHVDTARAPYIKWKFITIEHRATETKEKIDIYIAFEYYYRFMFRRTIIGKKVSEFINSKKVIPLLGTPNMDLETFLKDHKEINCLYYNTDHKTIELQYRKKDSSPSILGSVKAETLREYNEVHYCYFKVRYKMVFKEDPFLLKSEKYLQIDDAFFMTILQEFHPKNKESVNMTKTEKLVQTKKNETPLFEIDTVYLPALYYVLESDMDFFVPDVSGEKEVNLKQIIIFFRLQNQKLRNIKNKYPRIDNDSLSSRGDLNKISSKRELESRKGGSADSFDFTSVEDEAYPKPESIYNRLEDYVDFKKYLVAYYTNKDILLYGLFISCLNDMPPEEFALNCSSIMKYNSGVKANQNNPLSQNFPGTFALLLSDLKNLRANFLLEKKIPYIEKNKDEIVELRRRFLKYYNDRGVFPGFISWLETSESDEFIEALKEFLKKGQGFDRNSGNPIRVNNPAITENNFEKWREEFKDIIGNFD
jgi:hypothetical protein